MSSTTAKPCPLCDQDAETGESGDIARVYCVRCGTYVISDTALISLVGDVTLKEQRYLISGLTRRASDQKRPLRITSDDFDDLLRTAAEPRTPFDALDRFLLIIHARSLDLRGRAAFEYASDYPLLFVRGQEIAKYVADKSSELELTDISMDGNNRVHSLTLDGWRRVGELRAVGALSSQAFVAMSFHSELDSSRANGFLPALKEAGYTPMILTTHEHNDLIDDVIVSEIRRSGLLVVDFTRHAGGAYFEAGLAMGLGMPVIRTCRSDGFPELHFDVNHYNVIKWDDPSDLREKLLRRILATVPARA
jgi:hypothetical protein